MKALDGKDGIVRWAIPTEYEDALQHLDREQRLEAERRASELAREMDEFAREAREENAAETARERRAEAQREREQRDAELTERAMRLEQERQAEAQREQEQREAERAERAMRLEQERQAEEWKRQAEERERKSKALLERNLQIAALQQTLDVNLAACDRIEPKGSLCWNQGTPEGRAACERKFQEEVRRADMARSECRNRVRTEHQSAIATLMLSNP